MPGDVPPQPAWPSGHRSHARLPGLGESEAWCETSNCWPKGTFSGVGKTRLELFIVILAQFRIKQNWSTLDLGKSMEQFQDISPRTCEGDALRGGRLVGEGITSLIDQLFENDYPTRPKDS